MASSSSSSSTASLNLEIIGAGRHSLLEFTSLQKSYKTFPIIGWNRHVETIFASFFRSLPRVPFRRECLRTPDGGTVAIDWVSGDDRRLPADSPVLILLPGLTGGSGDTYVRHMLVRAKNRGWRVIVFNSRGCADSPVTTPQFYSASFTQDLSQVVSHVSSCYTVAKIYAVGWSLGANILVRYLDEDFHKGFNNIYDKALARSLRKIFNKHALLFEDLHGEYNIPLAANAKTVRDFDQGLTRVSFGFKSVDDYYFNSSSSHSIPNVQIPLLCIQAANDPIAPSRGIPRKEIKENPHCSLIVTPQGGHLGWVAGDEAPFGAPWTDPVVMEFLEHLHKDKNTESAKNTCLNQPDGVQQSSPLLELHIQ